MKISLKKIIKYTIYLFAAAAVTGVVWYKYSSSALEVKTVKAGRGRIEKYVEDTGKVKYSKASTIYSSTQGIIKKVYVRQGDRIRKGQTLAVLSGDDYKYKLQAADAQIQSAEAQLKGAVTQDNLNKIETAQTAVDKDTTAYNETLNNYNNNKELYNAGYLSKDEMISSETALKNAEAALKTDKLQLNEAQKAVPDYIRKQYNALVQEAFIQKTSIKAEMEKLTIKAPFDGIVLQKSAEEGSYAAPGGELMKIAGTGRTEIEADILSDDIYNIKIGDIAVISGNAIGDRKIYGRVTEIAPEASDVTNSLGISQNRIPVTIELKNASGLRQGLSLDVRIITKAVGNALLLPETSVFDYNGGYGVFTVNNGKAEVRRVIKGLENDDMVQVTSGIGEGQTVIKSPDDSIKEGMKIKAVN